MCVGHSLAKFVTLASDFKRLTITRDDVQGVRGVTVFLHFQMPQTESIAAWPVAATPPPHGFHPIRDEHGTTLLLANEPFDLIVPGLGFVHSNNSASRSMTDQTTISFMLISLFETFFQNKSASMEIVLLADIRASAHVASVTLSSDHISEIYPDHFGDGVLSMFEWQRTTTQRWACVDNTCTLGSGEFIQRADCDASCHPKDPKEEDAPQIWIWVLVTVLCLVCIMCIGVAVWFREWIFFAKTRMHIASVECSGRCKS